MPHPLPRTVANPLPVPSARPCPGFRVPVSVSRSPCPAAHGPATTPCPPPVSCDAWTGPRLVMRGPATVAGSPEFQAKRVRTRSAKIRTKGTAIVLTRRFGLALPRLERCDDRRAVYEAPHRELVQLRPTVHLEHPLLPELPQVLHAAGPGVVATGVLLVGANVHQHLALHRLDDVEEADLRCLPCQRIPAMGPTGRSHQPCSDEGLEDLRQEVLGNIHLFCNFSERRRHSLRE